MALPSRLSLSSEPATPYTDAISVAESAERLPVAPPLTTGPLEGSETLRLLAADWRKIYRYHGGLPAALGCLSGSRRLERRSATRTTDPGGIEFVTFSAVPRLTSLWLAALERTFAGHELRVSIGDCSGALHRYLKPTDGVEIHPMLNRHHGEKLDLMVQRVCRAEYLVLADDDILWLDTLPLSWALERLRADPRVAAVGIVPKKTLSSVLDGKVEKPMGSLIVIRRSTFLEERLSFRVHDPEPGDTGAKWIYDTGEYAQVELGRRGYRVELAPPELRQRLVFFEAMSSWILKMQKWKGDIRKNIETVPLRQEKLWHVIRVARGLAEMVHERCPELVQELVSPRLLSRAEFICSGLLDPRAADQVGQEVEQSIERARSVLDAETLSAVLL